MSVRGIYTQWVILAIGQKVIAIAHRAHCTSWFCFAPANPRWQEAQMGALMPRPFGMEVVGNNFGGVASSECTTFLRFEAETLRLAC